MLNGLPPFYDRNKQVMFEQIQYAPLIFPSFFSASSQTMLKGLLTRDPKDRLGSGNEGSADIQSCPFFTKIDWFLLEQRKIQPPWTPSKQDETDTRHFDTRGVSMSSPGGGHAGLPSISPQSAAAAAANRGVNSGIFSGFTFVPENEESLLQRDNDMNATFGSLTEGGLGLGGLNLDDGNLAVNHLRTNSVESGTTEDLLFALRSAMNALQKEQDPLEKQHLEEEIQSYRLALDSVTDEDLFNNALEHFDGTF